ncbi:MAG TPA: TetR/AcrR family transcriptional regulator [Xanthobacteraceae bacterium]|jgi:AcrR family transcriptional regulator
MNTATRREQLKEALTDAAVRMIAEQGLSGLKARALADAAGCAVGAIYNVVADLDELILHANARTLAALEKALTAAATSGRGPDWAIDQLVKLALAYLEFAASHRRQWQALFDHRIARGDSPPDWYQRDLERLFGYIEQPVAELLPDASPARRALLARSLFSAAHGLVALGLEEKLQFIPLPSLREQVTTIVSALGYGLAGGD